jgi:hypothetical protein
MMDKYPRTNQIMRVVAESGAEGLTERGYALRDAARAAIEQMEDELASYRHSQGVICPACDGEREVTTFTGNAPCPECSDDAAVTKGIAPTMVAEAVRCLRNAEPLIRGWAAGPVSLAHQEVVGALRFLAATNPVNGEGSSQK